MTANVPCNFLVLLVVEKGNVISAVSALTASTLPSLTVEDHGSGEEKEGPQGLQIMSAGERVAFSALCFRSCVCAVGSSVCILEGYMHTIIQVELCIVCLPTPYSHICIGFGYQVNV